MKQIPNIFTLLNLFAGCLAIVFALQTNSVNIYVNDNLSSSFNIPEKLSLAGICIFIAAIIDFLDGFLARMLKASSEMGKQLDSLSDVVSFGVAPGVIIYQLFRFSYAREPNGLDVNIALLLPAFFISCAAAYRLARFNLDQTQQFHFKGLPVPAVGILIASFPLILQFNSFGDINNLLINKWLLYSLVILLSFLMLSSIPMLALKFKNFSFRDNMPAWILILIALVSVIIFQWLAVPIIFITYLILSFTFLKTKAT
jgi:CDP-diacylglycerol--serine O-phosphatidyltransferase